MKRCQRSIPGVTGHTIAGVTRYTIKRRRSLRLTTEENCFYLPDIIRYVENSEDNSTTEAIDEISTGGLGTAVVASIGSVALALYFYYVRGDKQRGQFVGLWPTTILAVASYFKLEEIKQTLEEADI